MRGSPRLRRPLDRLLDAGVPLAQTAIAAGASWFLAADVIGHNRGFFAPIAAVIALGLAAGERARRALEVVLFVAVGVACGDVLIAVIGVGPIQVALVVLLAMAAAVLLGATPLGVTQAAASAVLVATLQPPSRGIYYTRFEDALIGGAVGLAVLALLPADPVLAARRRADPLLEELAATFEDTAGALEASDPGRARSALARARSMDAAVGRLRDALVMAGETTRLAPGRWRARHRVARYADAAAHVELAVRNARVLARAAVRATELEDGVPQEIRAAVHHLAAAALGLRDVLRGDGDAGAARAHARRAAAGASALLDDAPGLSVSVLVGLIRSTAVDLLAALGVEGDEAIRQVRDHGRA